MTKLHVKDVATLIRSEVIKLKSLIQHKQAAKLKFSISENIYDQLTGDSESKESIDLLNKCAKPYSRDLHYFIQPQHSNFDSRNKAQLFSALEVFCQLATPQQLKVIHSYLKGNVNDVYLNRFLYSLKP